MVVVESRERNKYGKEVRKQLEIDFIAAILLGNYMIPSNNAYTGKCSGSLHYNRGLMRLPLLEKAPVIPGSGV